MLSLPEAPLAGLYLDILPSALCISDDCIRFRLQKSPQRAAEKRYRPKPKGRLDYTEDNDISARFAICLYGEWGSGKTYYCENVLKPALKNAGCKMLRISLFGVESLSGLYDRMLSAICRTDAPRIERAAKSIGKGLFSALNDYLSTRGIRIDIGAETIISAMTLKKTLIVLDDAERSKLAEEDLFGTVNDMVENHRWHIMLVRNKPIDIANNESEKTVSRQFEYRPSAESLFDATVANNCSSESLDFDLREAFLSGIKASGQLNARALMRIMPTIKRVAGSEIMHSEKIAPEGRKQAFADVVRFSLAIASGDAPSKPERTATSSQQFDMQYVIAHAEWEKYQSLADIASPIGEGRLARDCTISKCLKAYIEKEYPESPADIEAKMLCDQMEQVGCLDDQDVSAIASKITSVISKHAFSSTWLYRLWTANKSLSELGFIEALSVDDAKRYYKEKVDEDPMSAYAAINAQYSRWIGVGDNEQDPDLEDICQYAMDSIKKKAAAYSIESIVEDSGVRLVAEMEKRLDDPLPTLVSIPPAHVAACFFRGNASSQYALHEFFNITLREKFGRISDMDSLAVWLDSISTTLNGQKAASRMGRQRQEWLIRDLSDILARAKSLRKTEGK